MNNYRIYLSYITCFLTGASTLLIELISFRIMAPYFGTSSYVTGIIINTVLLALALGYYIGGFIADKYKNMKLPYLLILSTAIYLFVIYLFFRELLGLVGRLNVIFGSIISIFIMFLLPMMNLAFIPTYLIRMLTSEDNIGKTVGKIYSLSTFGSIIGGIVTTFILIPFFGSSFSFLVSVVLLFILSIVGLISYSKRLLLLVILIPLLFVLHPSSEKDYVYSTESQYNIIKVKRENDSLYLYLNNYYAFHSKSLDKNNLSNSYYDYFLLGPMIVDCKEILILGNGAGTAMTELSSFFNVKMDAVEIDEKMTETGKNYFNLKLDNNVKVIHKDARVYLNKSDKEYDMIIIDLYSGSAYVPFHLATVEFFKLVKEHLKKDGVVFINIPNYALITILEVYYVNTIQQVFDFNFIVEHIFIGFKEQKNKSEIIKKISKYKDDNILKNLIIKSTLLLRESEEYSSRSVFTDDCSQIEKLTFSVINQ